MGILRPTVSKRKVLIQIKKVHLRSVMLIQTISLNSGSELSVLTIIYLPFVSLPLLMPLERRQNMLLRRC
jgi:hypothetical protein